MEEAIDTNIKIEAKLPVYALYEPNGKTEFEMIVSLAQMKISRSCESIYDSFIDRVISNGGHIIVISGTSLKDAIQLNAQRLRKAGVTHLCHIVCPPFGECPTLQESSQYIYDNHLNIQILMAQ